MDKSHFDKLGIKQVIRIEWMDRCLSLLLSGMSPSDIRKDLITYLADKKQSGGLGERGEKTYTMAIYILAAWYDPIPELIDFRNNLLKQAKKSGVESWFPLHWALMIATYPLWYNVALQTGRILALQERVTQKQIFDRLIEHYGDRETVLRNARYTVRSFVAWGALNDTDIKGIYQKGNPIPVSEPEIIALLIEAILLSIPNNKASLRSLINSPALFPFCQASDLSFRSGGLNSRLVSEQLGDGELVVSLK
jgi:hypothetical protein